MNHRNINDTSLRFILDNEWYMPCDEDISLEISNMPFKNGYKYNSTLTTKNLFSPVSILLYLIILMFFLNSFVLFAIYFKRRRFIRDQEVLLLHRSHLRSFNEDILEGSSTDFDSSTDSLMSLEEPLNKVDEAGKVLNDSRRSLAERFRALFILRNVKTTRAVEWIVKSFADSSELLKHELAYCLGQMQNPEAIPYLISVLKDLKQEPIVRHEAAEALGAIGEDASVENILKRFLSDENIEVAQTCELALKRIQWNKNRTQGNPTTIYNSVDPVPASSSTNVEELQQTLVDESKSMWERYRAMFALRNLNTKQSIMALTKGLECKDSALFRHEIAYVLGQIQSPLTIAALSRNLKDPNEQGMVRHECAEALGSIAEPECEELLKEYALDSERVVRESCEVALDMAEHEKNEEFQYAKLN